MQVNITEDISKSYRKRKKKEHIGKTKYRKEFIFPTGFEPIEPPLPLRINEAYLEGNNTHEPFPSDKLLYCLKELVIEKKMKEKEMKEKEK